MPKRKWARHLRGEADYGNELRRALPTASNAARRAVSIVAGRGGALAVHDTSHLFIAEKFETIGGGECSIKFYHPLKLAQHVLDNVPLLAQYYGEVASVEPDKQWRVILGCDEQTPGSKVNLDNQRKNMCLVFNFLEVGADFLEDDGVWYVPMVIRKEYLANVIGGWSAIFRQFLRHAFLGPLSFSGDGLLVRFKLAGEDKCVQIKADLHTIITDGEGLQKTLQWNGPSSMRPTFDFSNVFKRGAGMVDATSGYVDITCSELTLMRRWQSEHWLRNIDGVLDARERRDRGELTDRALKLYIKAAGFCATKQGLLADTDLRDRFDFLEIFKYDHMHTAFQDGFMSNAMWLICSNTLRLKHGNASDGAPLVAFLKSLQFPVSRADGKRLHTIFTNKFMNKHRGKNSIVANASCQLTLYKLLEFWAIEESTDCPELLPHCAVYCAASEIADVFRNVKHRRLDTHSAKAQLIVAIKRWQELHKTQYGATCFKPKFCWIWSIALDLSSSDWLFDMFYVERQHRRVRAQVEPVKNTVQFEGSVLQRVLDAHVSSLLDRDILANNYCLPKRKTRSVCGGVPALMADSCVCKGVSIHCDDLVERCNRIGVVIACYQCDDDGILVLRVEVMIGRSRTQFSQTARQALWPARDVQLLIAWRARPDRSFDVIRG